jgi:hypothetical protein
MMAFDLAGGMNFALPLAQIRLSRIGQQAAQIGAIEQQIAVGAGAGQAVAQDVAEHLRGGLLQRRVERGDAQRRPELFDQIAGWRCCASNSLTGTWSPAG